jgi:hypothetical protein
MLRSVVRAMPMRHIVAVEGPVLDAVLARRIARAHGFVRTGSRIQERVDRWASGQFAATLEEDAGAFYWPKDVEPGSSVSFRRASDDSNARGVEEICMQELVCLARTVQAQGLRLRAASRGRLEIAMAMGAQACALPLLSRSRFCPSCARTDCGRRRLGGCRAPYARNLTNARYINLALAPQLDGPH